MAFKFFIPIISCNCPVNWLHNINSDFAFIEDFSNFVFAFFFFFLDFRVNKAVANKLLNDSKLNKKTLFFSFFK